jgi:uncharacterized membrane protein
LTRTTPAIFFTRWITHFCAPVFIFLAGTSAWLMGRRGSSRQAIATFLFTRGLWLVVLEMTVVLLGTTFNLDYAVIAWQVIWAIGWCMIALSALIFLPLPWLAGFSALMIAGHNLFDGVKSESFGSLSWFWKVLHEGPSMLQPSENHVVFVVYPLIPWIAVISAGYCLGRIFDLDHDRRRRVLLQSGIALTIAFVLLRATNLYGDMHPWAAQNSPVMTVISFLNATKYPPSLIYLLMTLGPALIALGLLDGISVSERNPFLVFGKVPLFYYVLHWYALHLAAIGLAWFKYGRVDFLFGLPPSVNPMSRGYPPDYGYGLGMVYLVWIVILVALYPLCLRFARVKARHRAAWLSYL